jgi:hypothetical protein
MQSLAFLARAGSAAWDTYEPSSAGSVALAVLSVILNGAFVFLLMWMFERYVSSRLRPFAGLGKWRLLMPAVVCMCAQVVRMALGVGQYEVWGYLWHQGALQYVWAAFETAWVFALGGGVIGVALDLREMRFTYDAAVDSSHLRSGLTAPAVNSQPPEDDGLLRGVSNQPNTSGFRDQ